jgi:hypothetical protein
MPLLRHGDEGCTELCTTERADMAALLHGRARRRDAVLTKELTHLSQTSYRSSKIWIGLQREIDPNDSAHAVEVRVEADAEEDGRLPRMRRVGHLQWATHGRCGRASSSRFAPSVVATRPLALGG